MCLLVLFSTKPRLGTVVLFDPNRTRIRKSDVILTSRTTALVKIRSCSNEQRFQRIKSHHHMVVIIFRMKRSGVRVR